MKTAIQIPPMFSGLAKYMAAAILGIFITANTLAQGSRQGVVEYEGKWYHPGDTIYGYKNYVKLVVGHANVPLLLGIPHDGVMTGTPEIPGTSKSGRDIATKPFTMGIAELFRKDTGLQPWIMINEIHRQRVDPNTYPPQVEKRYGVDTESRKTYDSYHELMMLARSTMATNLVNTKGGLFIDMHAHGHKYANDREEPYTSIIDGSVLYSNYIRQSEIGYALSAGALEKPDSELDKFARYSSIYAIAKAHPEVPFSQLIRGPYSLGALMDDEGIFSVPGRVVPVLERDAKRFGTDKDGKPARRPYFTGGFLIRKYGTSAKSVLRNGTTGFADNISSIQIESTGGNVRNNQHTRARSTHKFKRAIIKYLNYWYGCDFPNSAYPFEYYKMEEERLNEKN